MKRPLLLIPALVVLLTSTAQPGKQPVKKTPPKPAPAKPAIVVRPMPGIFKSLNDSASYCIGMSVAGFCRQQGIAQINTALVTKSITDILNGKPVLMDEASCNNLINTMLMGGAAATAGINGPARKDTVIQNALDSISYAIGANHATFFKQQGLTQLNTALILRGAEDILASKPSLINDRLANGVMNRALMKVQEESVRPTIEAGKTFLAKNKLRPGVKVTASGLQYEILKKGTGIRPTSKDTFVCHYRGTLIDGTPFDASYDRGQPLEYPLGKVIAGWTEGLQLMPVGSSYKFYIPYNLGYGLFGSPPVIPGGATLVFEIELLGVKKAK